VQAQREHGRENWQVSGSLLPESESVFGDETEPVARIDTRRQLDQAITRPVRCA
jgi:hypothetical protein